MFVDIRYYLIFLLSVFVICSSAASLWSDNSFSQDRPSKDEELHRKKRNPFDFPPMYMLLDMDGMYLHENFRRPKPGLPVLNISSVEPTSTMSPSTELRSVEPASTWDPLAVLSSEDTSTDEELHGKKRYPYFGIPPIRIISNMDDVYKVFPQQKQGLPVLNISTAEPTSTTSSSTELRSVEPVSTWDPLVVLPSENTSTDEGLRGKKRYPAYFGFPPIRTSNMDDVYKFFPRLNISTAEPTSTTSSSTELRSIEPAATWNPLIVLPPKEPGLPKLNVSSAEPKPSITSPSTELRSVAPASNWNPPIVLPSKNLSNWLNLLLNEFGDMISGTSSRGNRRNVDVSNAIMKLEIFTLAAGNHFILPPNADQKVERQLKRNAEALGSIWLDLRYTGTIDAILNDVVNNISSTQYPLMKLSQDGVTTEKMRECLQSTINELFNRIDQNDDSNLGDRFSRDRKISAYDGVIYFPFDDLKRKIIDEKKLAEWLENLKIRKFLIHKQFLELGKNPVYYKLVRPIYDLAPSSGISAVEQFQPERVYELYVHALEKTARSFIVDEYPQKVVRTLVDELMGSINSNEFLKHIYEVLKSYYHGEESLAFEIL